MFAPLGGPSPPRSAIPALFTRMSSRPNSFSILARADSIVSRRVTSSATNTASTPSFFSFATASSPNLASRAPTSTVQFCLPSWRATSKPMPLLAPVIKAIFFDEGIIVLRRLLRIYVAESRQGENSQERGASRRSVRCRTSEFGYSGHLGGKITVEYERNSELSGSRNRRHSNRLRHRQRTT